MGLRAWCVSDRSTHGGKVIDFWFESNPVHFHVNIGLERIPGVCGKKAPVFFWGRDEVMETCSISGVTAKEGGGFWTGG